MLAGPAAATSPTSGQHFKHTVVGGTHYTFTNQFNIYNGGSIVFTTLEKTVDYYLTDCHGGNRVSPVRTAPSRNVAYGVGVMGDGRLTCVNITVKAHVHNWDDPMVAGGATGGALDTEPYLYKHTTATSAPSRARLRPGN